jgi:hypothetical protein
MKEQVDTGRREPAWFIIGGSVGVCSLKPLYHDILVFLELFQIPAIMKRTEGFVWF